VPNPLQVTVENPDEILNAGLYGAGAVVRLQSSTTETQPGTFADLSGTGSTPTIPVVAATRTYTGYDPAGTSTSWYRTRYENAGATRVSDWSASFQVGDETAGLLCSTYDVTQRLFGSATVSDSDRENIAEIIRNVSNELEDHIGAWLAPRPTSPTSTTTFRFDVERSSRRLWLQRGKFYTGIRTITAISTAVQSQPETGGTLTAATLTDVLIRPQPSEGEPGWWIEVLATSGLVFYAGQNTVEITGSFGPARVAGWAQEVAIAAVTRRFLGKETATTGAISLGPEGAVRLLASLSPDMAKTVEAHRFVPVG